ncbi:MAG: hypothetical protein IT357_02085 [Gemmatimonadaceae bacterium]|nr:hypothetical protein [Gemmatimonadaceae bacterium]
MPVGELGSLGIPVLDASSGSPAVQSSLDAVVDAVRVLEEACPTHHRWLKRTVRQIVLVPPMPALAAFDRFGGGIEVNCEIGAKWDIAAVAAVLVHEATHARIASLGVEASSSRLDELRGRIERRCVREQLAALRRIAPEHPLVEWSQRILADETNDAMVPSEGERRVMLRRTYHRLRTAGAPRWLSRFAVSVFDSRKRRSG